MPELEELPPRKLDGSRLGGKERKYGLWGTCLQTVTFKLTRLVPLSSGRMLTAL